MSKSTHFDSENLKTKPKLSPDDFPTRQEAWAYAEERLDSLLVDISELESNMIFLSAKPTPAETTRAANNSLDTIWGVQDQLKDLKQTGASK